MKKVSFLALSLMLFYSCNTNTVKGKVLYVFYFTNLSITEYQLKFITDEIVEVRTTLAANSFECITYKNTPKLTEEVKLYHYSCKDYILEIPEIKFITKLTADVNIHPLSNEGSYANSIVEVLDDKDQLKEKIMSTSESDKAEMYLSMLNNNSEPLMIKENGKYKSNPNNFHNKSH